MKELEAFLMVHGSAFQARQDLVTFIHDHHIKEEATKKLEDAASHISKAEVLIMEAARLQLDTMSEENTKGGLGVVTTSRLPA